MLLAAVKDLFRLTSPLIPVLVVGGATAWLVARPSSRGPRRLLLAFVLLYWLASSPIGANVLVAGLSRGLQPLPSREAAGGADTVVVLGGGADTYRVSGAVAGLLTQTSIMRALESARVARLIDARLIIASGGSPKARQLRPESALLREMMVGAGVPDDRIFEESGSNTTREQVAMLEPLLRAHRVSRFVLVTSPLHMRRSLATFRAAGLDPVPSVSPLASDDAEPRPLFLPNNFSLYLSDQAVYGYAAGVYYWVKGWTRPSGWR